MLNPTRATTPKDSLTRPTSVVALFYFPQKGGQSIGQLNHISK